MFENEMQTRAAICGAGVLLAIIFLLAGFPLVLLIGPVAVIFLGVVADPEESHAVWYGMLNTIGIFDFAALTELEKANYAEKRHYFWFGEVGMASILAGIIAFPLGVYLAGKAEVTLAFIGAATVFLSLFVFLPKIIRRGMKEDTDAVIDAFGKNEHVRKVFLDGVHGDERTCAGPGAGSCDSSADYWFDYVSRAVRIRIFTRKTRLVWGGDGNIVVSLWG